MRIPSFHGDFSLLRGSDLLRVTCLIFWLRSQFTIRRSLGGLDFRLGLNCHGKDPNKNRFWVDLEE